jgi:hypothetical protein
LGDASDLASLAESLKDGDINVSLAGQDYVLMSDLFCENEDAGSIRQKGRGNRRHPERCLPLGVGSLQSNSGRGRVRHEDGKLDAFVFLQPVVWGFRAFTPTVKLSHADGTVEEFRPADPVRQWARMASENEADANVFRILAGGILDWVNLYRILEIVESDVGRMNATGWATKSSTRLFKHTANSPGALGLEARHGAESTQPPEHPMTISEARALVYSIVHAWLRSKSP